MLKKNVRLLLASTFAFLLFVVCNNPEVLDFVQDGNNGGDAGVANTTGSEKTVADAMADNCGDHEEAEDYIWNSSDVIQIVLNGNSITVNGSGTSVNGSKVTIVSAGTYSISGSLSDGQIIVDTEDEGVVRLILNGIDISSSTSAPVYINNTDKAIIILKDNTVNRVTDGNSYIFENSEEDEPNAAIFSKDDLTIYGNGSLTVDGNYNDGIASKDGLIIKNSTITVNSTDDGIRGKDYLIVKGGNVSVDANGDGLKSDNDGDPEKGYVFIESGKINITAGGDAITAETDVLISDGEIALSSGGGSNQWINESISAKGIKSFVTTVIDNGTMNINSADDAIHSNGSLAINGGSFVISSGDDGIHADSALGINGGDIRIIKSYEGIESRSVICVNNGDIHIVSSDDGLNVAGGMDGSGFHGGGPGNFDSFGNYYLYINGGYIAIDAAGDGIDSNGSIVMTDGCVIVHGPTSNMNGALDHSSFKITGGFLVAAGSSGMAQAPGTSSTQYSVLLTFRSAFQAGTLFHIQTSDGDGILSFTPAKKYQSIVLSSSELVKGTTYVVYYEGSSTGTVNDGLYQGGTYTPGTKYTSFTVSGILTNVRNR